MKSNFVKLFCSTAISLVLILSTMVITGSCSNWDDNDCPGAAVSRGERSSGKCADSCGDAGYSAYFIENGICCCWD